MKKGVLVLSFVISVMGIALYFHSKPAAITPSPPEPPAKTVVRWWKVDQNMFSDNTAVVKVENIGKDGWIQISVKGIHSWSETQQEPESVTWFKNMFTAEGSSGYTEQHFTTANEWIVYTWITAGETKFVTIDLSGERNEDSVSESIVAGVMLPPKDAVLK